MKKVKLTIKRKGNITGTLTKVIEVNTNKEPEAKMLAQIIWLKEYVNRDGLVTTSDDITELKRVAKVSIDAEII